MLRQRGDPEEIISIPSDGSESSDTELPKMSALLLPSSKVKDENLCPDGVSNLSSTAEVRKEGKPVSSGKDDADHLTILNILLQNPEELLLKHKPSAIRENKIFTLDMREIPISSAEADDNGAYISKGSAKQWYTYNESGSTTVHKTENGAWYLKVKEAKMYT